MSGVQSASTVCSPVVVYAYYSIGEAGRPQMRKVWHFSRIKTLPNSLYFRGSGHRDYTWALRGRHWNPHSPARPAKTKDVAGAPHPAAEDDRHAPLKLREEQSRAPGLTASTSGLDCNSGEEGERSGPLPGQAHGQRQSAQIGTLREARVTQPQTPAWALREISLFRTTFHEAHGADLAQRSRKKDCRYPGQGEAELPYPSDRNPP